METEIDKLNKFRMRFLQLKKQAKRRRAEFENHVQLTTACAEFDVDTRPNLLAA